MTHMADGIEPVVGDDIFFARFAEDREHDITDLVPKQMVLQMAIERPHRGIVLRRIRRALLEVQGE